MPGADWSAPLHDAHSKLSQIIDLLSWGNRRKDDFNWIVEIRDHPRFFVGAELHDSSAQSYSEVRKIHRVSDPRPIAVITVSTGALGTFETESELAFSIGHEITHHIEGHTSDALQMSIQHLLSSQSDEFVADRGALDLMRGRFRLQAAHRALYQLESLACTDQTEEDRYRIILNRLSDDHPHSAQRLALIQLYLEQTAQHHPAALSVADRFLPKSMRELDKLSRGRVPKPILNALIETARHLKASASEPFSNEGVAYAKEAFEKLPDIWKYSNSDTVLRSLLEELKLGYSADRSAQILLLSLILFPFSNVDPVLQDLDPGVKAMMVDALKHLGVGKDYSFITRVRGTHSTSEFYDQISRHDEVIKMILRLAQDHPAWDDLLTRLKSQMPPADQVSFLVNFPDPDDLHTAWQKLKAQRTLLAIPSMRAVYLAPNATLPGVLAKLKRKTALTTFGPLIGREKLEEVTREIEAVVEQRYAEAVSSRGTDRLSFLLAWMQNAAVSPADRIDQDLETVFEELLANGIKDLSIARHYVKDTGNWIALNKLLFRKIVDHQTQSAENKLQLLMAAREMGDRENFLELLANQDPKFRNQLIHLFRSVPTPIRVLISTKSASPISILRTLYAFLQLGQLEDRFIAESAELGLIIEKIEKSKRRFDGDSARMIRNWAMLVVEAQGRDRPESFSLLSRALGACSDRVPVSPELVMRATPIIESHLSKLTSAERHQSLKLTSLRNAIDRNRLLEILAHDLQKRIQDGGQLHTAWAVLSDDLDFSNENRDLAERLRHIVAERLQLQPLARDQQLPILSDSRSKIARTFWAEFRIWSAVVTSIQDQGFQAQIQAFDYLMGRSTRVPSFISELHVRDRGANQILQNIEDFRARLSTQTDRERALFVQSCLEGPRSRVMGASDRKRLLDYLSSFMKSDKRAAAIDIFESALEAEEERSIILVSQILSQRSIDESVIVKTGLQNYFVPGLKFGQYLVFTGDFKEYEETLASTQDSVTVDGYYDLMVYLHESLHEKLDLSQIRIISIIGAGTVNIAFE